MARVKAWAAALLGAVTACAAPEPKAPPCPEILGIEALLDQRGAIVLGAAPGTNEHPKVAAALICHAVARGETVTLALEWPRSLQPWLDAKMAGAAPAWPGVGQNDGRFSTAVLALVDSALSHNAPGKTPRALLVAIDSRAPSQTVELQESALASSFEEVRGRRPSARVVAFVGPLHAARAPLGLTVAPYMPMAGRLERVTSLLIQDSGGAAWMCAGPKDACGPKPIAGDLLQPALVPQVKLLRSEILPQDGAPRIYDGVIEIGPVSPSAPIAGLK
jgi:hypothetical protein